MVLIRIGYFLLLFSLISCQSSTPASFSETHHINSPPSSGQDSTYISVDLRDWEVDKFPEAIIVDIPFDHSLQRPKRYKAYPFKFILDLLVTTYQLDTTQTEIVFECKDGYIPSNSLAELYEAGGGYLAFQDMDAEGGKYWLEDKEAAYAPYYLVWDRVAKDDHHLAWPFGLIKLRIVTKDPYVSLYPSERPDLVQGFEHYKTHCIKCHSLNKIGGIMGPEFNIPQNITEYWERNNIIAFAQDPQSFRYNSKMYAIRSLNLLELNEIVDYLEYIATRKVTKE